MADPGSQISQFIKWVNDINWVISLLVSIPLSIFANLLTQPFQDWIASRSLVQARKRVKALEDELSEISQLCQDRGKLHLLSTIAAFKVLLLFGLSNAIGLLDWLIPFSFLNIPLACLFSLMGVIEALNHIRLINRIIKFDKYKIEMEARILQMKSKAP